MFAGHAHMAYRSEMTGTRAHLAIVFHDLGPLVQSIITTHLRSMEHYLHSTPYVSSRSTFKDELMNEMSSLAIPHPTSRT